MQYWQDETAADGENGALWASVEVEALSYCDGLYPVGRGVKPAQVGGL